MLAALNPVLADALAFRNECAARESPLLDWGFLVRHTNSRVAEGHYDGIATQAQISCAVAVLNRALDEGTHL